MKHTDSFFFAVDCRAFQSNLQPASQCINLDNAVKCCWVMKYTTILYTVHVYINERERCIMPLTINSLLPDVVMYRKTVTKEIC